MPKKKGGRLISSAGLVNYYESEDRRALQISPVVVIAISLAFGIFILILSILY